MVKENLNLIDVVVELVDARIPISSRNPIINEIIKDKPRCLVLNKADLADPKVTKEWEIYFKSFDYAVIKVNSLTGEGISLITNKVKELAEPKQIKYREKGFIQRPIRIMVVGIPNVGKSSFINKLAGKVSAKTGNKPGVTKGKQWIKLSNNIELLDTPGILWPKFEDRRVGLNLAFTGSIKEEILDTEKLAIELLKTLCKISPEGLRGRFKLTDLPEDPEILLELIGSKRGCIVSGGIVDLLKAATIIIEEYQRGKLGLISLEHP